MCVCGQHMSNAIDGDVLNQYIKRIFKVKSKRIHCQCYSMTRTYGMLPI